MKPSAYWYGNARLKRAGRGTRCNCDDCREDRMLKIKRREKAARLKLREGRVESEQE